ncbi:hypothetical protein MtrunA17_Chr3g0138271 [Medicago truncatula]|uniref:Uncharacterized protein n=1 Tax=Medicago truncatula TaxID=3880 RepID=A0A396IYS8_MEDTR|nr:hypothetical protein MtrunA17_Chr3g0138271 [Medicago truncatula]
MVLLNQVESAMKRVAFGGIKWSTKFITEFLTDMKQLKFFSEFSNSDKGNALLPT